jgi:hypothetical protein
MYSRLSPQSVPVGGGDFCEVLYAIEGMPPKGTVGLTLVLPLSLASCSLGEWFCSTMCSHHDVLSHHKPKATGQLIMDWNL